MQRYRIAWSCGLALGLAGCAGTNQNVADRSTAGTGAVPARLLAWPGSPAGAPATAADPSRPATDSGAVAASGTGASPAANTPGASPASGQPRTQARRPPQAPPMPPPSLGESLASRANELTGRIGRYFPMFQRSDSDRNRDDLVAPSQRDLWAEQTRETLARRAAAANNGRTTGEPTSVLPVAMAVGEGRATVRPRPDPRSRASAYARYRPAAEASPLPASAASPSGDGVLPAAAPDPATAAPGDGVVPTAAPAPGVEPEVERTSGTRVAVPVPDEPRTRSAEVTPEPLPASPIDTSPSLPPESATQPPADPTTTPGSPAPTAPETAAPAPPVTTLPATPEAPVQPPAEPAPQPPAEPAPKPPTPTETAPPPPAEVAPKPATETAPPPPVESSPKPATVPDAPPAEVAPKPATVPDAPPTDQPVPPGPVPLDAEASPQPAPAPAGRPRAGYPGVAPTSAAAQGPSAGRMVAGSGQALTPKAPAKAVPQARTAAVAPPAKSPSFLRRKLTALFSKPAAPSAPVAASRSFPATVTPSRQQASVAATTPPAATPRDPRAVAAAGDPRVKAAPAGPSPAGATPAVAGANLVTTSRDTAAIPVTSAAGLTLMFPAAYYANAEMGARQARTDELLRAANLVARKPEPAGPRPSLVGTFVSRFLPKPAAAPAAAPAPSRAPSNPAVASAAPGHPAEGCTCDCHAPKPAPGGAGDARPTLAASKPPAPAFPTERMRYIPGWGLRPVPAPARAASVAPEPSNLPQGGEGVERVSGYRFDETPER